MESGILGSVETDVLIQGNSLRNRNPISLLPFFLPLCRWIDSLMWKSSSPFSPPEAEAGSDGARRNQVPANDVFLSSLPEPLFQNVCVRTTASSIPVHFNLSFMSERPGVKKRESCRIYRDHTYPTFCEAPASDDVPSEFNPESGALERRFQLPVCARGWMITISGILFNVFAHEQPASFWRASSAHTTSRM